MGVTRNARDIFDCEPVEDDLEYLEPAEEETALQQCSRRGGKARSRGRRVSLNDNGCFNSRKRCGHKQIRRAENLKFLLNLAEKDELGESAMEKCVFESSMSHFGELLMEREKMKIWNDFVNRSEEEQERILQDRMFPREERGGSLQEKEEEEEEEEEDGSSASETESWVKISDKREVHPAFSAHACYKRIDRNLKAVLRKRHFCRETLKKIEEEIISFFQDYPSSVYISQLTSGYERMMLHALCQYLDLRSQSFNEENTRRTQVENKHDYFSPPSTTLSDYLQRFSS